MNSLMNTKEIPIFLHINNDNENNMDLEGSHDLKFISNKYMIDLYRQIYACLMSKLEWLKHSLIKEFVEAMIMIKINR